MAMASEGELENMILSTPFALLNLFVVISGSKIKMIGYFDLVDYWWTSSKALFFHEFNEALRKISYGFTTKCIRFILFRPIWVIFLFLLFSTPKFPPKYFLYFSWDAFVCSFI